jgi:PKD repeat protein
MYRHTAACLSVLMVLSLPLGFCACPIQRGPTAGFSATPTSGTAPLTVHFTDQSDAGSSAIAQWHWQFGDGGTATGANPAHVYTAAGIYSVTLTVTTAAGSDSETRQNLITVTENGAGEATYYVSPNGNDAHPGSQAQPWRTIQRAADTAGPGDTVTVLGGVYGENVELRVSGQSGAPITLQGAGASSVIDGYVLFTRNVDYVTFSGFTVQNFPNWGITLDGDNDFIHLSDLTVIGGEAGVHFTYGASGQPPIEGPVSHIVFEDSVVRDCEYSAVDCTPGPCDDMTFRNLEVFGAGLTGPDSFGSDGIAVERGQNIVIEDCYVHDNGGDGIDLNSRDRDGNVAGIVVRRNEVARNHLMGIKLWAGGLMENNFVWGQGISPLMLGRFPCTLELVNNTVACNMWSPEFGGRDYAATVGWPDEDTNIAAAVNLTMINNIFAFNSNDAMGGPTGIHLGENVTLINEGHNLYFSREDNEIYAEFLSGGQEISRADITGGAWQTATSQGAGNLGLNPMLAAPWPNVDLRITAGSPAIDAGTATGAPAEDIFGAARPQGSAPDIGAHERN